MPPPRGRLRLLGRLGVQHLGELVRGLLQRVHLGADLGEIVALERLAQLHDPALDRRGLGLVELVAVLGERALGLVGERLGEVLRVRRLAQAMRLFGMRLRVVDHLLHLVVREAGAALDLDLLDVPVPMSFADTLMIPFASMSKVTSICGMPRGAGGIPTSWNLPSVLLYAAISDSP